MALVAPSNLVVTPISSTRCDLAWKNNDRYNFIHIYRNEKLNGEWSGYALYMIIGGSLEYWADTECVAETQYCYKLRGRKLYPMESSDYSNEDCTTTFKAVHDPSEAVATPISDIEIDFTFKDNSLEETGHRLERKLGAGAWGFVVELEPNREFFRDGGLFLLEAGYTDCVEGDIGKQVKDDGDNIGLLVAHDNVRRRWLIDSGSTIADASAMTIAEGTGAGTAARATTGLVKDSLYTYQVQASAGTPSGWDESAQVRTFDVPSAPVLAAILDADTKDKSIRIRWNAGEVEGEWKTATLYHVNDWVKNNGSSYICILEHTSEAVREPGIGISWITYWEVVTGVKIEQDKDTEGYVEIATIGAEITGFLATGLTPGATYSFKIQAYNAAGDSGYSNIVSKDALAAYVPTEFEKWIRDPGIKPVYLAEIYTKMTLTGFTLESGAVWKKTIGASDRGIDILEVFEDGDAYIEKTSVATVQATAQAFWFDYDNRILYIQTTPTVTLLAGGYVDCVPSDIGKQVKDDGVEVGVLDSYDNTAREWKVNTGLVIADASAMTITGGTGAGTSVGVSGGTNPSNFLIEGAFWLYFSTHKDIEFTVNGRLNHYLLLLSKEDIPDISQENKPYFEGSFSISSGSIAFMNAKIKGEHFFDKKFRTYTWINSKIILKAGKEGFIYSQFKEIFTARINEKDCSDKKITFQLRDIREEMKNKIILNKFDTTNYPGVEKKFEDKPIPIYLGAQELVTAICIEENDERFKCNDGRIKSIDMVYKNEVALVEDVHYFVDLRRAVVTFNRDGKFIIAAGINDKIDFKEGAGSELNVTLDPGTYTAAELCAEIKSEMEAANSLTFTVTADPATKKFTIAASGEFSLLWKTGTNGSDNTDKHVGSTIGFNDDEDDIGESSYEADEDVITIKTGDHIEVSFTGLVNSADEVIENGAEVFKYLMNNYKGLLNSELDLDSVYESKYANTNELSVPIDREISFDEIVRTIEHSIEAYTFQDALGRLGIRPQQTTVASNAKYVVSKGIFDHSQKKGKGSLFWKVNIFYGKNLKNDDWEVKTATDNEVFWKYGITEELDIYTYLSAPSYAQSLATSILNLLNKEEIHDELPMLLFDVMPGDLTKFSRTRFFSEAGTVNEITLRIIKISKSPANEKTTITAEEVE